MKTILFLALFISSLVLLGQIDDELAPEANALLAKLEAPAQSEAYLYLLGIDANEQDSPEKAGSRLLAVWQQRGEREPDQLPAHEDSEPLPLPMGELFCRTWEKGCLARLFSADTDMEGLKTHSVVVERSIKFHAFQEYRTLITPSIDEPIPPFQYLAAAERLKVLAAITAHKEGRSQEAASALQGQLSAMRGSMALQDTLIGKLVFATAMAEAIDVLNLVSVRSGIEVEPLDSLTPDERDFGMAAAREFALSYSTFKDLDRHPEIFQKAGRVPGWIVRLLYKPHMTSNALVPAFTRTERLSLLSPSRFAEEIELGDRPQLETSRVRNPVGRALIAISTDHDDYVARLHDLDAKIALFNRLHGGLPSTDNPYYPGEAPETHGAKACFRGPLDDERHVRCLRTQL